MITVPLEELRRHAEELTSQAGVPVSIRQEGLQVHVTLQQVPLPAGAYRVASTDVLFLSDMQYPLSAMDMFWTEEAVLRPDGSVPTGADCVESYGGRKWRRFSWHRNGLWNPAGNGLLDHFEFMLARFAQDVTQR